MSGVKDKSGWGREIIDSIETVNVTQYEMEMEKKGLERNYT